MRKFIRTTLAALLCTMTVSSQANAATLCIGVPCSFKLSDKTIEVVEGDTFTISASGSAALLGKTTWATSNDDVLEIETVHSGKYGLNNGYKVMVSAAEEGTASIIAKNSKTSDTLACTVTVNAKESDESNALITPTITTATSSGTSKTGKVKMEWSAVDGAKEYKVQISKKSDFSTLFRDAVTTKTSYNTGWNFYNQVGSGRVEVYYCRVKVIMSDGQESTWSDIVICTQE